MSQPDRLYRVRWRRPNWAPTTSDNYKFYLRESSAIALVRKLIDSAAASDEHIEVHVESRTLEPGEWTSIEVDQ